MDASSRRRRRRTASPRGVRRERASPASRVRRLDERDVAASSRARACFSPRRPPNRSASPSSRRWRPASRSSRARQVAISRQSAGFRERELFPAGDAAAAAAALRSLLADAARARPSRAGRALVGDSFTIARARRRSCSSSTRRSSRAALRRHGRPRREQRRSRSRRSGALVAGGRGALRVRSLPSLRASRSAPGRRRRARRGARAHRASRSRGWVTRHRRRPRRGLRRVGRRSPRDDDRGASPNPASSSSSWNLERDAVPARRRRVIRRRPAHRGARAPPGLPASGARRGAADPPRPSGLLVLTTPNSATLQNRVRLLLGRSVHTPLHDWMYGLPHARHAREYTAAELRELVAHARLERRSARGASLPHPERQATAVAPSPSSVCSTWLGTSAALVRLRAGGARRGGRHRRSSCRCPVTALCGSSSSARSSRGTRSGAATSSSSTSCCAGIGALRVLFVEPPADVVFDLVEPTAYLSLPRYGAAAAATGGCVPSVP